MTEPLADMPLELYAAVVAALGEGYSLGEILEHEGLSEDAWEAGEEIWIERLGDSAESDLSLCDEFERALSAQRARFAREVPPLDSDLDAFIAFQRILSAEQRPLVWLTRHGLNLGDWVRLQERWAERLSQESEDRARAAELMRSPDLPELPRIEPAARMWPPPLRKWATSAAITTAGETVAGESIAWGLDAIRGDRPARTPKAPPAPSTVTVPSAERTDALPRAAERVARPTFMQELAQLPALQALLAPLLETVGSSPGEITLVPTSPAVASPTLPFAPDEALHPGELTLVPTSPAVASPTLPFAPDEALHPGELTLVPSSPAVASPALPFSKDAPAATEDRIKRDHGDADRTLPPAPLVFAQRTILPFAKGAPASPPWGAAAGTSPEAGHTLPPAPLVAEDRPDMPFAPAPAVPSSNGPVGKLTLEEYAALCAELAVTTERSETVFLRYGLASLRERLAVDLAWQDRLRRNPTEHQAWAVLYARYHAHFALRSRGGDRG